MNKHINFEDTVFIINVRINMIRDLLRLNVDANYFYSQSMSDLEFINIVMNMLTEKFLENLNFIDREVEADNLLDAEWQFCQLLNEISNNSSPFSPVIFPETPGIILRLKKENIRRKNQIEESYIPTESSKLEPVVSHAELNGLLGSA
jgi:hypothetical protein